MSGRSHYIHQYPLLYVVILGLQTAIVLGLGTGGLLNLAADRLNPQATRIMVAISFITLFLIPFGIWGLIELDSEEKRRHPTPRRDNASAVRRPPGSPVFARKMASLSWISAAFSILDVIICGGSHDRGFMAVGIPLALLGMLVSLAVGIYALTCLRTHGRQGILWPALAGTTVSLFFVLALLAAFITGMAAGMRDKAVQLRKLDATAPTQSPAPNSPPASPGT